MHRVRLSNVPLPEGHLAFLALGSGLHWLFPRPLFRSAWPKHVFGWPLLFFGALGVAWAVAAAQAVNLARPNRLVTAGPYQFSRNPMYVAWTMLYLAAALLANNRWLLLSLPGLVTLTHYFVIRREEQSLEQAFGAAYRRYRAQVRRYY